MYANSDLIDLGIHNAGILLGQKNLALFPEIVVTGVLFWKAMGATVAHRTLCTGEIAEKQFLLTFTGATAFLDLCFGCCCCCCQIKVRGLCTRLLLLGHGRQRL